MAQFALATGQDEQIAHGVDADDAALGCQRLQDFRHVGRADELERHDQHAEPRLQGHVGAADFRGDRTLDGGRQGHDLIQMLLLIVHQCGAIHAQGGVECRDEGVLGDGVAGAQGNDALHARIDHIVLLQHVAQDDMGDLANVGPFEVERGALAVWRLLRLRPGGLLDELAGAGIQVGL
ncbi:hypothetical protein GALL_458460 [mine drainage metagenome]|uniref:Uncharacterized protein n=1 Tax=mine drainage metagenome TaxID=410659 RepID=A0A1J5PXJ3_9ZZZZ